ncbi:MAG: endolytic transglycosylase MltG [Lachnospiraceae bacterium]|nr:endolytic transglycosylase MltG [Lachnospiraceae bacterium]
MDEKLSISKVVLKIVGFSFSVLILLFVVYALYRSGQYAYDFGYRVFTETAVDTVEESEDKVVQITGDMGAIEIGNLLEKKGLIRNAELFFVQLKLSAYAKEIKEGTYTLSTSMTAREMMQVMSAEEVEDTETEE